jgi:glycosyltransferase involved in cell wall biosynthesis
MNNSIKPGVSVILTIYNGMPFINDSIESVLAQSYSNIELIIIDDGSNDGTKQYLKKEYSNNNNIKLIDSGRIGRAKALNLGLKLSRGKYIGIIDADDIFLRNKTDLQVKFLEKNSEYVLVGSKSMAKNFDTGVIVSNSEERPITNNDIREYFLIGQPIQHSCVMIRKTAIDKIGGYNEETDFLLDRDLFLRLAINGGKLYNLNKFLVHIGIHNKRFFYHTFHGKIRIKKDYHYRFVAARMLKKSFLFKIKLWLYFQWNLLPLQLRSIIKLKFIK